MIDLFIVTMTHAANTSLSIYRQEHFKEIIKAAQEIQAAHGSDADRTLINWLEEGVYQMPSTGSRKLYRQVTVMAKAMAKL